MPLSRAYCDAFSKTVSSSGPNVPWTTARSDEDNQLASREESERQEHKHICESDVVRDNDDIAAGRIFRCAHRHQPGHHAYLIDANCPWYRQRLHAALVIFEYELGSLQLTWRRRSARLRRAVPCCSDCELEEMGKIIRIRLRPHARATSVSNRPKPETPSWYWVLGLVPVPEDKDAT